MELALIQLGALASPLFLILLEKALPYPYVIEEIVKLFFVTLILGQEKIKKQSLLWYVVLWGGLFAVSETLFYLSNILMLQTYGVFFMRLVYTGILHVATVVIIYLFSKKIQNGWMLGFTLAMIIHFLYNLLVLSL